MSQFLFIESAQLIYSLLQGDMKHNINLYRNIVSSNWFTKLVHNSYIIISVSIFVYNVLFPSYQSSLCEFIIGKITVLKINILLQADYSSLIYKINGINKTSLLYKDIVLLNDLILHPNVDLR